jgi:hypothetical protein
VLEKLYVSPLLIPKPKLVDLKSLCTSGVIPAAYHVFYESLTAGNDNEGQEQDGSDVDDESLAVVENAGITWRDAGDTERGAGVVQRRGRETWHGRGGAAHSAGGVNTGAERPGVVEE